MQEDAVDEKAGLRPHRAAALNANDPVKAGEVSLLPEETYAPSPILRTLRSVSCAPLRMNS